MILKAHLDALNKLENIAITEHARIRLYERHISIDDVMSGIQTGTIIQQYPNDTPLPSCFILGFSTKSEPIHLVISRDNDFIYLITAYFPDPDLWENDYKTRKER